MSPPASLRLATLGALALLALLIPCLPRAAHAATHTTVSLTFDDGIKDQFTNARPLLRSHGMNATFYVISGQTNLSGYMSRDDISTLAADGDEIGGHTVDHPDLTTLSSDDVKREICNDRVTLLGWGFTVKNFAYPFGAANASVEVIKKKRPGGTANGGTYVTLGQTRYTVPYSVWQRFAVRIKTSGGDLVAISVRRGDREVLTAVDDGAEGPAILARGAVGLRGDNCDFEFRDFRVTRA